MEAIPIFSRTCASFFSMGRDTSYSWNTSKDISSLSSLFGRVFAIRCFYFSFLLGGPLDNLLALPAL
jgi:hypothetical protein